MRARLTPRQHWGHPAHAAAQSAAGIAVLFQSGESRIEFALRLFSCTVVSLWAAGRGAARLTAALAVLQPCRSPTSIAVVVGGSLDEPEHTTMNASRSAAKAAKPRAAKHAAPISNVIPFPAAARERTRLRNKLGDRRYFASVELAKEKGWTFVPPAAKDLMWYQLALTADAREPLLELAKALYANKKNRWPMYQ